MIRATVQSIDRATQMAVCADQAGVFYEAAYGDPFGMIPPLSEVILEGSVDQYVACVLTPRRLIFHDDFAYQDNTKEEGFGDTNWHIEGGGTIEVASGAPDPFYGATAIQSAAVAGDKTRLRKNYNTITGSVDTLGYWFSARANPPSVDPDTVGIGIIDGVNLSYAFFDYSPANSANWRINASSFLFSFQHDTGVDVDATQWYDLDLLIVPDAWVVGWIDGVGPFLIDDTTAVPNVGDFLTPQAYVTTAASAAASTVTLDWMHTEVIGAPGFPHTPIVLEGVPGSWT